MKKYLIQLIDYQGKEIESLKRTLEPYSHALEAEINTANTETDQVPYSAWPLEVGDTVKIRNVFYRAKSMNRNTREIVLEWLDKP